MGLFLMILVGCGNTTESDPCDGLELPICELAECPEDYQDTHGDACSENDVDCTTGTGTGRVCVDGVWSALEPNHGEPGECNIECVFSEE